MAPSGRCNVKLLRDQQVHRELKDQQVLPEQLVRKVSQVSPVQLVQYQLSLVQLVQQDLKVFKV
jgi:hypothetical protein